MRPAWSVVNLIGWAMTGASVTSLVWVSPGPAAQLFAPGAPWQTVVSAVGAGLMVGVPGLLLLVLATLSLLSRASWAEWGFARRFEQRLEPESRRLYPVFLAIHASFVLTAISFLVSA